MIYYLSGKLTELYPTNAVIDCAGVGYSALISSSTYEKLVSDGALNAGGEAVGIDVKLYTAVRIRDESVFDVFGFYSRAEREMFSLLQTVSGVGPKAALAILSVLSPGEICLAVLSDDTRAISKAQGVGQKAAQKICIDLKTKSESFMAEFGVTGGADVSRETLVQNKAVMDDNQRVALEALVNLGYTKAQAQKALESASGSTVEDLIRTALAKLF